MAFKDARGISVVLDGRILSLLVISPRGACATALVSPSLNRVTVSMALAKASVAPVAVAAPVVAAAPVAARLEEFDPLPQYRFGYDVADSLTGDYKSQTEQRDGRRGAGPVLARGPDGTRRVVDYAADPVNGFNAVVRKEPLVAAAPPSSPSPARIAAAPVAVAPRYTAAYTAPVGVAAAYAAPARFAAYTAPVAAAYTAPVARLAAYSAPFAYRYAAPANYVAV
ncbi:hypothetical protein MSG28_011889 [Choristoneura fumiferana]|uniref:Uncharacterized protein n=1 Tax=Choristoneura fumiferana TaxID=7141 RepID=A0ACC0KMG8_CHOFU|nr:hypothetical protein MSG28_011889 [Choristoneura fumiferana]